VALDSGGGGFGVGLVLAARMLPNLLFGLAAGGVYLAKGALAGMRTGAANAQAVAIARFFAETLATAAPGLKETVLAGAEATLAMAPDALSA